MPSSSPHPNEAAFSDGWARLVGLGLTLWMIAMFAAYLYQFRDMVGPLLRLVGLQA